MRIVKGSIDSLTSYKFNDGAFVHRVGTSGWKQREIGEGGGGGKERSNHVLVADHGRM